MSSGRSEDSGEPSYFRRVVPLVIAVGLGRAVGDSKMNLSPMIAVPLIAGLTWYSYGAKLNRTALSLGIGVVTFSLAYGFRRGLIPWPFLVLIGALMVWAVWDFVRFKRSRRRERVPSKERDK